MIVRLETSLIQRKTSLFFKLAAKTTFSDRMVVSYITTSSNENDYHNSKKGRICMGVTIELDVREDLRQKREPFEKIMNAIKPLQPGDTFILHAPFKPLPLFPIMKAKGFTYEAEQIEKKHWKVTFIKQGGDQ
ncbi:Conserved hypothetical protein [Geobacillus thermodenitrificans NG80-2]|jgi:uncharacterized protein (DUF2249 family)|uniref:DUF2249 domain-containing protein n=2 Tax=Geobacillus thermodenitrificans TaxID=33940 RepID=A4IL17_GEOTN|nr:Conserved hypothetical protein [Geobacillus thermodenitrificans NG80-2]